MDWAPPWGLVAVFVITVIGSANSVFVASYSFNYFSAVWVDGVNKNLLRIPIGVGPVPRIEEVIFTDFVKLLVDGTDMFGDFLHYGK